MKNKNEYTGPDYTKNFKRMRCRKRADKTLNKSTFSFDVKISDSEYITKTVKLAATSSNCNAMDKRRTVFESDIILDKAKPLDIEFFIGKNTDKLAKVSLDNKKIKVRFIEYVKEIESTNIQELAPDTIPLQRNIIYNSLIPAFGDKYLKDLTFPHLNAWVKKEAADNVQRTLSNKFALLHNIIFQAIRDGAIDKDILANCFPKALKKSDYVINAFSSEEREAILSQDMPDDMRNIITFWLFSGLRSGEIFGLTWAKFDKAANTIQIDRQIKAKGVWKLSPKTSAGNRKFKLLERAREAILNQEKITKLNSGDLKNPDNLVFMDMDNMKFWGSKRFKIRFKKILADAGVEYRRPYNMRHSFATMILALEGRDILSQLSKMIGHKSVTTTEQLYVDNKVQWIEEDWSKTNKFFSVK